MTAKKSSAAAATPKAYQLHIELRGVRPKVWRRLLVPATIKLPQLHVAILWCTGWDGGHLHEFIFEEANYGPSEPGWGVAEGALDEDSVSLKKALGPYGTFTYVYDFGDNWQHKVKVEKIVELDAPLERPLCIAGANACPPEDVGGAPGYAEFLEALADPANPEHDSLSEWIGGSFDPTHFDVDEVNLRLRGE